MNKITQILLQERENQQLTLKQASQFTKIPVLQLHNLEQGNWSNFSSSAYLQGVLQRYAKYLGLDPVKMNAYLKREIKEQQVRFIRVSDYSHLQPRFSSYHTAIILVLLVLLFFGLQLYLSWQKPLLQLNPIPHNLIVNKPLVIKGQTEKGVLLYLNDEPIYQDEQGKFSETLYYKTPGERKLILKAIGVNGQEQEAEITVKITKP